MLCPDPSVSAALGRRVLGYGVPPGLLSQGRARDGPIDERRRQEHPDHQAGSPEDRSPARGKRLHDAPRCQVEERHAGQLHWAHA